MGNKKSINYIKENALCTACGGCEGVCPTNAINMAINVSGYIVPEIDMKKCNDCGMCYEVCPSVRENTKYLYQDNIFHGKCIEGYIGYATDEKIRRHSQSGGVVTALLCYLLDKNLIDGAIVNNFNKNTKKSEVVLARSKQEIKEASGSYYIQSNVVSEILKNRDYKLSAVTLGCQSESIHLIKKKNLNIKVPEYNLGLICAGEYSINYIDYLINISLANNNKVFKFRFRDKTAGGWPGKVKIYSEEGDFVLNKKERTSVKPVFMNHRCLMCFDQMNIYSDIVFGDPWGIRNETNKKGNTVMIARTDKGNELIESASNEGYIKTEKLEVEKIIKGQTVDNRLKTQYFTSIDICKNKGLLTPYDEDYFSDISYDKPSKKKKAEIANKFNFSRKVFLIKNHKKYNRMVSVKIKKIKAKLLFARFTKISKDPKRVPSYLYRKLKKLQNNINTTVLL